MLKSYETHPRRHHVTFEVNYARSTCRTLIVKRGGGGRRNLAGKTAQKQNHCKTKTGLIIRDVGVETFSCSRIEKFGSADTERHQRRGKIRAKKKS